MNSYMCSSGERVTKGIVTRNIRHAKAEKVRRFKNDNGYIYCEFTKQSQGTYIDIMHIISVDECQKSGRTELAWSQSNLRFGSREFHANHDKKTRQEREDIYIEINGTT